MTKDPDNIMCLKIRLPTFLLFITSWICTGAVISDLDVVWSHHGNSLYTASLLDWTGPHSGQITVGAVKFNAGDGQSIYGFSYVFNSNHIVHSDRGKRFILVTDFNRDITTPLVLGTSPDVGQITIDWTSHNIYWADSGFRWIAMKTLPMNTSTMDSSDQGFKIIADKYLYKPSGLVVYPDKFFLFWADEGAVPKIERSSLDGLNRIVIVQESLVRPQSLAIDFSTDILYWTDPGRHTIEGCDLDGQRRHIFVSQPEFDFFGLAIYQDSLIFTVPNQNISGIYSLANETFGNPKGNLIHFNSPVFDVEVFSKEQQPREVLEPCETTLEETQCEQICIQTSRHQFGGFDCYCKDGYLLPSDGRSCERSSQFIERSLLFTDKTRICQQEMYTFSFGRGPQVNCDVIVHDKNITRFSVDVANKVVFFADDNGANIYRQTAFEPASNQTLYQSKNGQIADLDYDWRSGHLFWSITGSGQLYFLNVAPGHSVDTLNMGDNSDITHVAVDPIRRKVYFMILTDGIYSLHVWVRARGVSPMVIPTKYLLSPTDMEYDWTSDSILWFDDVGGYLATIKPDGTKERVLYDNNQNPILAVCPYKNYVIMTSPDEQKHIYILYDRSVYTVNIDFVLPPILDVHMFASNIQPEAQDRCEVDNGGCEHLCLTTGSQQCDCFHGYHLQQDKRSCSARYAGGSDFFFALDSQFGIIRIDSQTLKAYVAETNSESQSRMAFDQKRFEVLWIDTASRSMRRKTIDKENDDEAVFGESVSLDSTLAIDTTNGNVYFSDDDLQLKVVGRDDTIKTLLHEDDIKIIKIALFPKYGKMAWIEGGDEPKIARANMDGTNVVFLKQFSDPPNDIVYDVTADDEQLYYCHSIDDNIVAHHRGSKVIYDNGGHKPIAMDVTAEFIYFIPGTSRKIIRVDKIDGGHETMIVESPLSGLYLSLYVSKPTAEDHAGCILCNGGCSTLCLPFGEGNKKTCGCADNDALTGDGICGRAAVCDIIEDVEGLNVDSCCQNVPTAVCRPNCSADHSITRDIIRCKDGNWDYDPADVCDPKPVPTESGNQLFMYIGAAAGAVVLVIIIIIVIICLRKRRASKRSTSRRRSRLPSAADLTTPASIRGHDYASAGNIDRPPVPAPRPLSEDEEADGGVYTELDEVTMNGPDKLVVNIPQERRRGSSDQDRRNRYSGFPNVGTTRSLHNYLDLSEVNSDETKGQDNKGYDYAKGYITPIKREGNSGSNHGRSELSDYTDGQEDDGYLSSLSSGIGGSVVSWTRRYSGDQENKEQHSGQADGSFPKHEGRRGSGLGDRHRAHQTGTGDRPRAHQTGWHGNNSDYLRFINRS